MKTQTKIIMGVVVAAVVGVVIYLVGKGKKPQSTPSNGTDLGSGIVPDASGGGGSSGGSSRPSTGFKTAAEGNAFRQWVNKTHALYAISILLDKTGAYDNSYIRKAYAKYGADYKAAKGATGTGTIAPLLPVAELSDVQVTNEIVSELYAAMKGIGFNSTDFEAAWNRMKTLDDFYRVEKLFGKRGNPPETLREWMQGEYLIYGEGKRRKYFNNWLTKVGHPEGATFVHRSTWI